MFETGELAVIQGVGYPLAKLSHFVSTDVWHSGETAAEHWREGWYGNAVIDHRSIFEAADLDAHALLFSPGSAMARGEGVKAFLAQQLPRGDGPSEPPAKLQLSSDAAPLVRQLADRLEANHQMAQRIARRLGGRRLQVPDENAEALMQQVQLLQTVMASGLQIPLFKLEQGGYDTHSNQVPRQTALFSALDAALTTLRRSLRASGLWDDTVVLVHSEFGRRVAQNGYDGTDHGTAGPAFLLGGRVGGGLHGQAPRLDALDDDGNLRHGIDLRRLYASVQQDLWRLPGSRAADAGHDALGIRLA